MTRRQKIALLIGSIISMGPVLFPVWRVEYKYDYPQDRHYVDLRGPQIIGPSKSMISYCMPEPGWDVSGKTLQLPRMLGELICVLIPTIAAVLVVGPTRKE